MHAIKRDSPATREGPPRGHGHVPPSIQGQESRLTESQLQGRAGHAAKEDRCRAIVGGPHRVPVAAEEQVEGDGEEGADKGPCSRRGGAARCRPLSRLSRLSRLRTVQHAHASKRAWTKWLSTATFRIGRKRKARPGACILINNEHPEGARPADKRAGSTSACGTLRSRARTACTARHRHAPRWAVPRRLPSESSPA